MSYRQLRREQRAFRRDRDKAWQAKYARQAALADIPRRQRGRMGE